MVLKRLFLGILLPAHLLLVSLLPLSICEAGGQDRFQAWHHWEDPRTPGQELISFCGADSRETLAKGMVWNHFLSFGDLIHPVESFSFCECQDTPAFSPGAPSSLDGHHFRPGDSPVLLWPFQSPPPNSPSEWVIPRFPSSIPLAGHTLRTSGVSPPQRLSWKA